MSDVKNTIGRNIIFAHVVSCVINVFLNFYVIHYTPPRILPQNCKMCFQSLTIEMKLFLFSYILQYFSIER